MRPRLGDTTGLVLRLSVNHAPTTRRNQAMNPSITLTASDRHALLRYYRHSPDPRSGGAALELPRGADVNTRADSAPLPHPGIPPETPSLAPLRAVPLRRPMSCWPSPTVLAQVAPSAARSAPGRRRGRVAKGQ
jgi:hypothetical protein